MKKLLVGLLAIGSLSTLAGECTILLLKNGRPDAPINGRSSLKKCLKASSVLLEKNQDATNPTVVVAHTGLDNEIYMRLRDGLVTELRSNDEKYIWEKK